MKIEQIVSVTTIRPANHPLKSGGFKLYGEPHKNPPQQTQTPLPELGLQKGTSQYRDPKKAYQEPEKTHGTISIWV